MTPLGSAPVRIPRLDPGGHQNHRSAEVADILAHVGSVAPGSYGLVDIRDDEDPGHENEIRVRRLVRGTVSEHTETLLSPCVPALEDTFGIEGS
ncbi:Imm7 family immunity protein [Streptomyces sp. NPDC054834]